MVFNSLDFFLLFAVTVILYYCLPQKLRNGLLLISSYIFYAAFNLGLTLFLILCTLVTYYTAIKIEKYRNTTHAKTWRTVGVVVNLAALAFYKYFNFLSETLFSALKFSGITSDSVTLDLIVPLGISFIVFSVVSYIIDVYRGKIQAECSLFKLALYISFFPKVVQGPIERAGDILPQFDEVHHFDDYKFRRGILLMLWGLFMKMVVADRAATAVSTVYSSLGDYSGASICVATAIFALQIYCDFAGYSYIAIGAADILGFNFKQNFRQPYMSISIAEFWRRWHISLNNWLRDYLYIPLGGNRCSPARKNLNSLITFGLSGLWHGADWGYIIWGLLNAVYIIIENKIKAFWARVSITPKSNTKAEQTSEFIVFKTVVGNIVKRILVFIFISFSWIFFRAQNLSTSMKAVTRIFTQFNLQPFFSYVKSVIEKGEGTNLFGLDIVHGMPVLLVGLAIIILVDILSDRWDICGKLTKGSLVIRWPVYLFLIFSIIIFGVYGYGYSASAFIYAGF